MNSKIVREDAQARAEIDDYYRIVENYLVRYGDPRDDEFTAVVRLIEGCQHNIYTVATHLKERFPTTSSIEVRDEDHLDEAYIDLEWSDMEHEWDDHDEEFEERVISTLEVLSK